MRREAVLSEVIVADDLGNLKNELVRLSKRILADELHDLGQVILRLEKLTHDGAHGRKLREVGLVPRVESARVLGVRDEPVDRGEVLTLRKLLVKAPEDLDDAKRGGADGVGEIATGWGDGTDNGDGAVARGGASHGCLAGALVEGSEARAEVSGVAGVGRHLSETAGDFAEGLGPARGGVGHHGNVEAHVAHVLGEGDASVD
mmetsp:Transcript_22668/g.28037  ORF Transcript_22668/g.28037 Transcript_22668/m.28037 type:complete len:203 (-) Transcript_22668:154-762(-)